jgi:signal transduction histidine kinase
MPALGRNTERLHRLVESLLDFSRMETGKKPWNLQSMDAGDLAAGVAAEFQKEVEARGVRIDFSAGQSRPFRLRADAGRHQPRALEAARQCRENIRPDHARSIVSVERHPRGIAISVRDEGFGIPARERFPMGTQADSS